MTPPVALTIAGSDSGGGAGIQADLRAMSALGVFGASAITAVTVQDTRRVHAVEVVPASVVRAQIEVVLADLAPAAVKTGVLGAPDSVAAVAELADAGALPNLVVDPVLISTSGDRLLAADAEEVLREVLLPSAVVATPNRREAAALLDGSVDSDADAEAAGVALHALGVEVAVVTGGHPEGDEVVDVVVSSAGVEHLRGPSVVTGNDHGTGCGLSAAIAGHLALGAPPRDAVVRSVALVRDALARSSRWQLGGGRGPAAVGWSGAATGG